MQRKLSLILLIIALLMPVMASAQNMKLPHVRDARKSLRNDKKGEVEAVIKKLAPADSIEKYYLSGMLEQYTFEKANVNLYLGNKVDTAKVFKGLYNMFVNYDKAYNKVYMNDALGRPIQLAMYQHQNNLRIGGNYFISHGNYEESFKFYSVFLQMHELKLVAAVDSVLSSVYKNVVISASMTNRHEDVVKLSEKATELGFISEDIDLQHCESLRKLGRMDEWAKTVDEAVKHHPHQFVFYGMLIDHYLSSDRVEDAMRMAEGLVQTDSTSYLNCFVKGYVYQHTDDYDAALEWLQKSYEKNDAYAPCLSSLGYCALKKAEATENAIDHWPLTPEEKAMVQERYVVAKGYLEKARELSPKDKGVWANLLWKVYYKLNDGVKLEEIEKLME